MSLKSILLEQFTAAYDENGWFVALKNALENLTAEQASWITGSIDNSIWEIIAHLNFYNERYLRRFKGEKIEKSALENSKTFKQKEESDNDAWQEEVKKFNAIMSEWRELLEAANDEKLNENVSAGNHSVWASALSHINLHNAHHGGQIVILRKLQDSWDRSKGVS